MLCRRHVARVACSLGIFLLSKTAGATFSIVAIDTNSGEMGAAVVSCVGSDFNLSEVVMMQPNVGAVAAQSYFYAPGRDLIFAELRKDVAPDLAITAALDPNFDPPGRDTGPNFRQYAAVSVSGATSLFTGEDCLPHAGQLSGQESSLAYAISGNILTGQEVLSTLQNAFVMSHARVGMRLTESLRAVGALGKGDARCSPLTGDAGYFEFHLPGGTSALAGEPALSIEVLSPESEVALLLAERAEEALATFPMAPPESEPRGDTRRAPSGCSLQRGTPLPRGNLLLTLALAAFLKSRRFLRNVGLTRMS